MSDFDIPPPIATRAQVVAEARSYLGTPAHHQGRLPGVGLDCAGLPICVCWELGLKPRSFDVKGYGPIPDGSLQRYCDEYMLRIPRSAMQPGDVILVAWHGGGPQHLGIVVDHPYRDQLAMVHALGPRKPVGGGKARVIETRLMFGRVMQCVAAYSIPGVG